jgi:hypothetical protein
MRARSPTEPGIEDRDRDSDSRGIAVDTADPVYARAILTEVTGRRLDDRDGALKLDRYGG